MLNDSVLTHKFRFFLQSDQWSISQKKKLSAWQVKRNRLLPIYDDLFGERKQAALKELGIHNDHGNWCETQFQRFIKITNKLNRKDAKISRGHFLLIMNNMATLKGKTLVDKVPFDWLLGDHYQLSTLERATVFDQAQKILYSLSLPALPNDGYINQQSLKHLRRVFQWILRPTNYGKFLEPLTVMARDVHQVDSKRMSTILTFIAHNWGKKPDPELLEGYLDGLVGIDGKGRYQR